MSAEKDLIVSKIMGKKFELHDILADLESRLSGKDNEMMESLNYDSLEAMNVTELWIIRELIEEIADEVMKPISISSACSEVISILDSISESVVDEPVRLRLGDFKTKLEEIQDEVRELERNGIKALGLEDNDLLDEDAKPKKPLDKEEPEDKEVPGDETPPGDEIEDDKKKKKKIEEGAEGEEQEKEVDNLERQKQIESRKDAVLTKAYQKLSEELEGVVDELEAFLSSNSLMPSPEEQPEEQPEKAPQTSKPDEMTQGN